MSDLDASWPTTNPEARLASAPDKVPVRDSLNPGTRLDEFEIVRVLGTGGFGIVYLARDRVLERDVAIKEYMPAALAHRGSGATVAMRSTSGACARTFAKGLESFLSEARLLASFDHPSLVKVHRFWRSNATAYMAMPYYPGQTLKDVRLQMDTAPDEAWLNAFIQPLLGALELLHGQGVFHRDISPDNILMLPDGKPVLLDFGCARRVVASSSQSFTAHLKPQFAPIEQYADEAGLRQGPWTDLYSLGATLHFVLAGRPPTPSAVRAVRDVLPTLSSLAASSWPHLPASLLATIDWTLALAPDDRPQDVQTVRRALRGEIVPPPPPRQPEAAAEPMAAAEAQSPAADVTEDAAGSEAAASEAEAWDATAAAPGAVLPGARSGARRGMGLGVAAALGLMSLVALGLGAWSLQQSVPIDAAPALAVEATPAESRTSSLPARPSPDPVALATAASAPAEVAVPPSIVVQPADPVALRITAAAPVEYSAWDMPVNVAPFVVERSAASGRVDVPPRSPGARERGRATAPVRSKAPTAKGEMPSRKDACSAASGLLAGAICVLHPCRDPRARASEQCVSRQRAEQLRLRRMEWL